jgi:hypothetical protein
VGVGASEEGKCWYPREPAVDEGSRTSREVFMLVILSEMTREGERRGWVRSTR